MRRRAAIAAVAALACARGCAPEVPDGEPTLLERVEDAIDDVLDDVADPALGPRPRCALPRPRCRGTVRHCRTLEAFAPITGPGYEVSVMSDERTPRRASNWLRRDLQALVKYAAARVACETAAWPGELRPVVLGDMSQRSGQIPGSWDFVPRHPPHTHERGRDVDIAYYQLGPPDNGFRAICPHDHRGHERHHCVAPPTTLDAMRTALFIGALLEEPIVRVVGVDGQAGPMVEAAAERLCAARWIRARACRRFAYRLLYETEDLGLGWYLSHHHHLHVGAHGP